MKTIPINGPLLLQLQAPQFYSVGSCNIWGITVDSYRIFVLFWLPVLCSLQETFAKYTGRTSFERPLLNGVAYAQRVFHHEREMFESQQGWIMNTMKRELAPPQIEYAPVIFSQDTVSYLARIDMMSGEVRLLLHEGLLIHWGIYSILMSLQ